MTARRSILSVVRLMLEAGLPHQEILQTLDLCEKALAPRDLHPLDVAPAKPITVIHDAAEQIILNAVQELKDNGDNLTKFEPGSVRMIG